MFGTRFVAMRAARLLDMLLVLQRRGRQTARQLADALEVSERTILRDVGSLSEAGVPIRTSPGAGGGIDLIAGFETRLTGLTTEEAECLVLVGQPAVARILGLAAPTRSVQHKLNNAIGVALAGKGDPVSRWFLNDPAPWGDERLPLPELRRIVGCIRRCRRIELDLGDRAPVLVDPYGLVLKAGDWHLVAGIGDARSVIRLTGLRTTRLTRQRFDPPPDFSLPEYWTAHLAATSPSSL
jgi:predicted DNA-binding transcriptional regulator YafY